MSILMGILFILIGQIMWVANAPVVCVILETFLGLMCLTYSTIEHFSNKKDLK